MDEELNNNLKQLNSWKRIGFILIFVVVAAIVRPLIYVVVMLQIIYVLVTGNKNPYILGFGQKLVAYLYHVMLFMTFNTDQIPFPFSDWRKTEELVSTDKDLIVKE